MATLRVQLKPAQLAAALQVAGVSPTARSPLPALPAAGSDAAARKSLQSTGLLDAGRSGMTEVTKAALAALADPRLMIAVMANRAAHPEWAETMFLTNGPGRPFVAYAGDESGADVAILPSPAHVLALIDELACLTHLPAASGVSLDLDVAGFAALAAAADVVQEAKLEGMLDRRVDRGGDVLTAAALEDALARGMAASDPRWVVDAARAVSPPVFAAAAGRMAAGLSALQSAGLVASGGKLTDAGTDLLSSLGRLVASSGFTIAAVGADGEVDASHLGILRSVDAIWMAAWTGVSATDGRLTLYQASTTTALRLMDAIVDPLLAPGADDGADGGAGGAAAATTRRRTSRAAAGSKRAAPSTRKAAAPAAPAAAAVWAPTHTVPAGGMPAWATPDGSQAAVATLDAALAVQVVEETSGWAHIVCSNGWEAWVNASLLVPA